MAKRNAIDELPDKLKFETPFERDLRQLFKQMGEEFLVYYVATRLVLDFNLFFEDVRSLLKKNYRLISRQFKYNLRRDIELENITEIDNLVDTAISKYIVEKSTIQTKHIIETTNKEAKKSVEQVITNSAIAGTVLSNKEIADKAQKNLNQRNIQRASTIAQFETQDVAEASKFIEGTVITGAGVLVKKTWDATLDNKTRPAHAAADGQKVKIYEPYIVNGEMLRYPGDTSLGASIENTIHCRCSSGISL